MITQDVFDFLSSLSANNEREWFQNNKAAYDVVLKKFKQLVAEWQQGLSKFDPDIQDNDPNKAVFRIYRDVRFSGDKRPYKDHLGAGLGRGGRTSTWAGYYLHIAKGGSFLAGGKWMPEAAEVKKIRQEIDYNYTQLQSITNKPEFATLFGELSKEHSLKKSPRDYDPDHPAIEWLKLKSFVVATNFSDEQVLSPDFAEHLIHCSAEMQPFLAFLNTALEEVG